MSTESQGYPCPYCHQKQLETVATAPYVRGFIAAYQIGSKTFIGCVPCVRKKVLGEAALSLFIGWFSITALILNPIFILYNLIRGLLTGRNENSVKAKLRELGLPDEPKIVDVNAVSYALAASMIMADGSVDESELQAAEKAGDEVFGNFDEAALRMIVESGKKLPPVQDLAGMLRDVLDAKQKGKVLEYLMQIAMANGSISNEERQVIIKVAEGLGVPNPLSNG
ncbi:MAG: TerB family tellurite resistance protein [Planctomycetaceae bacterium]|nr:TerB family tellurite resistance protein [Planctomycetaceae bacterium]